MKRKKRGVKKKRSVRKKGKEDYERTLIVAITIALVLGLLLMATDIKRSVGYNEKKESQELKKQLLEDLESVEEKLEDVKEIIGISVS